MTKRIWVSDEVYALLLERKGKRSFSEVIKEHLNRQVEKRGEKAEIMDFAGALRSERGDLEALKSRVAEEREANYGRPI